MITWKDWLSILAYRLWHIDQYYNNRCFPSALSSMYNDVCGSLVCLERCKLGLHVSIVPEITNRKELQVEVGLQCLHVCEHVAVVCCGHHELHFACQHTANTFFGSVMW